MPPIEPNPPIPPIPPIPPGPIMLIAAFRFSGVIMFLIISGFVRIALIYGLAYTIWLSIGLLFIIYSIKAGFESIY
jgi:hypothetical protein